MGGKLFICASPIGNMEDITHRVLRVLREADLIAAEDTRRVRKILSRYQISGTVVSFHDHNERSQAPKLADRLERGQRIALIADAGMPGISDPGYSLVRLCIERNIAIEVCPGPSAITAALAVSGLPLDRFAFEGFLPRAGAERVRRIQELASETRTIVVFEAPQRLAETLRDLTSVLGNRQAAVARELTKVHEEVRREGLVRLADHYAGEVTKGEIVVVIEGQRMTGDLSGAIDSAKQMVEQGETRSRAAARSAKEFGVLRRSVYEALIHSGENGSQG